MATKEKTVDQLRDAAIKAGCRVIRTKQRYVAQFDRSDYYFQVPLPQWCGLRLALELAISMNRTFKKRGM
jgi:hypothetical protein